MKIKSKKKNELKFKLSYCSILRLVYGMYWIK